MASYNPIRILKNLFNDMLIALTGTWVGSPKDKPWDNKKYANGSSTKSDDNDC